LDIVIVSIVIVVLVEVDVVLLFEFLPLHLPDFMGLLLDQELDHRVKEFDGEDVAIGHKQL
jgi:hypothetical protein